MLGTHRYVLTCLSVLSVCFKITLISIFYHPLKISAVVWNLYLYVSGVSPVMIGYDVLAYFILVKITDEPNFKRWKYF